MKHRTRALPVIGACLSAALALHANADQPEVLGQTRVTAVLSGYQETPATINSAGSGEFAAHIAPDGSSIAYSLTYRNLTGVTQSHIHFGRPATTGSIVLFLCTNLTPPAGVPMPQPCPATGGTISGTLTTADVIASTTQSIDSGAAGFAEMIDAIRNHAAYVNVHTTGHASGEIRAALGSHGPSHGRD